MSELEVESPDDPRMIKTYRPFSGWAIFAFALAIISSLGMLNTQLFLFPVIALLVSLVACFRIGFSTVRPLGGNLALIAALLSGIFLSSGIVFSRLRQDHYFKVARQFADVWFDLVRDGEIYRPHHLLKDWPQRQASDVNLDDYYTSLTRLPNAKGDTLIEIEGYTQQDPEKSMRRFGRSMSSRFERDYYYQYRTKTEYFTLNYTLLWPPESGRPEWPLQIMLQRKEHKQPYGNQWTVIDVYSDEERGPKMFDRMRGGVGLAE